jgi:hypothetical protein
MSKVEKISIQDLKNIVNSSKSYAEILRKIGVKPGKTTLILKDRLIKENINFDHIKNGQGCLWNKGISLIKKEDVEKHLVSNSSIDRGSLKRYIIRFKLLNYICQICNQESSWKGKNPRSCRTRD